MLYLENNNGLTCKNIKEPDYKYPCIPPPVSDHLVFLILELLDGDNAGPSKIVNAAQRPTHTSPLSRYHTLIRRPGICSQIFSTREWRVKGKPSGPRGLPPGPHGRISTLKWKASWLHSTSPSRQT